MNAFWRETMDKETFWEEHRFWFTIALIWYNALLFQPLRPLPVWASLAFLCGMALLCALVGDRVWPFQRNRFSVFCNLAVPFGIYTVLVYFPLYGYDSVITIVFAGDLALAALYLMALFGRRIRQTDPVARKHVRRRRGWQALMVGRGLLAFGCAAMTLAVCAMVCWDYPNQEAEKPAAQEQSQHAQEILMLFQEETWDQLNRQQKLNALQGLVDLDCQYLGIQDTVTVRAVSMFDQTRSYYTDSDKQISINVEDLLYAPVKENMDSVLHELYHCFEHRLVDAYEMLDQKSQQLKAFEDIKTYQKELEKYTDGGEDYTSYYNQLCEIDARKYAEVSVEDYYQQIEEYQAKK